MHHLRDVRLRLLEFLAGEIVALAGDEVTRVAIDGVDGAGKTVFGDELAAAVLRRRARTVIRAGVDWFHHPPGVRYARGRTSPEGFFRDSYDYDGLRRLLLGPLSRGGDRRYTPALYDITAERPVPATVHTATPGSILVFDGIFLHRPELRAYWDYSIFLDVPFDVSVPRGAARGYGDPDPAAPVNHRYIEGQRLYLAECAPAAHATVVVDNSDLAAPRLKG